MLVQCHEPPVDGWHPTKDGKICGCLRLFYYFFSWGMHWENVLFVICLLFFRWQISFRTRAPKKDLTKATKVMKYSLAF